MITLLTSDLWQKHGFGDGEVLHRHEWGAYEAEWKAALGKQYTHDILFEVLTRLAWRIYPKVTLERISTAHNPVRAEGWDDDEGMPANLHPQGWKVPEIWVIEVARDMHNDATIMQLYPRREWHWLFPNNETVTVRARTKREAEGDARSEMDRRYEERGHGDRVPVAWDLMLLKIDGEAFYYPEMIE